VKYLARRLEEVKQKHKVDLSFKRYSRALFSFVHQTAIKVLGVQGNRAIDSTFILLNRFLSKKKFWELLGELQIESIADSSSKSTKKLSKIVELSDILLSKKDVLEIRKRLHAFEEFNDRNSGTGDKRDYAFRHPVVQSSLSLVISDVEFKADFYDKIFLRKGTSFESEDEVIEDQLPREVVEKLSAEERVAYYYKVHRSYMEHMTDFIDRN
jgi:hypothetical protein